jgi:hypothetical protein
MGLLQFRPEEPSRLACDITSLRYSVKDLQRFESGDFIVFGEEYSATIGPTEELLMSSMPEKDNEKDKEKQSDEKSTVTLPATVDKIVQPVNPKNPEMAEIHIERADPLYREIRVENTLKNDAGEEVKLKKGSHVDVTIEADADATIPKKPKAAS